MGKNSGKNEQKIQKKKENKLRAASALKAVQLANEILNPLEEFSAFHSFYRNGLKCRIKFYNVTDMSKDRFQAVFDLEKFNMKNMYNKCSWGWDEAKKWKEMCEKTAKYLIAENDQQKILGFSHFRFDMDFGVEVLYCYELQLDPEVRRKGLGKFLLQILELIAFKNNMKKVVLTVLKHNTDAVNFFYSLGYKLDETNPASEGFEDIPYEILSKKNKRLLAVSNKS